MAARAKDMCRRQLLLLIEATVAEVEYGHANPTSHPHYT